MYKAYFIVEKNKKFKPNTVRVDKDLFIEKFNRVPDDLILGIICDEYFAEDLVVTDNELLYSIPLNDVPKEKLLFTGDRLYNEWTNEQIQENCHDYIMLCNHSVGSVIVEYNALISRLKELGEIE